MCTSASRSNSEIHRQDPRPGFLWCGNPKPPCPVPTPNQASHQACMQDAGIFTMCQKSMQKGPSASARRTKPALDAARLAAYERTDRTVAAEGSTKAKEEQERDVLSLMNQQNVLFPKPVTAAKMPCIAMRTPPWSCGFHPYPL